MAEHPDYDLNSNKNQPKHTHGTMDIQDQEKTYVGFLDAAKYLTIVSIAAVLLVGFLTL